MGPEEEEKYYNSYPLEDRLCFAARTANASIPICYLMEEASIEVARLRTHVDGLLKIIDILHASGTPIDVPFLEEVRQAVTERR